MERPTLALTVIAAALLAVAGVVLIARSGGGGPAHAVAASPVTTAAPTTLPPTTTTTTDPGLLAQTTARPSGTDPAFQARMRLLWDAIVTGHAGVALPAFFPLSAYRKVKALPDSTSDWQHRLVADFDADIARVHASLGPTAADATPTGVVVPDGRATWVIPGAEVNRIGYWRVYNTTMTFTVGGVARSVVVISLISWRGQWYVVHFRTPPR